MVRSRSGPLTLTVRQGSAGEEGCLRQLLQGPLQVLGGFTEGSTTAGFHLVGRDRGASLSAPKRAPEFSSCYLDRTASAADGWGRGQQGEGGSYTAAVDGQEQERQWAVLPD